MPYAIRVTAGQQDGEVYPLSENREIIIGRSPTCNIFVHDRFVSRYHCQISLMEHRCTLTDLQSTNGIFVNGERMTECELALGYEIRVGATPLQLVEMDDGGRSVTTAVIM